jgi:hypothetical protein
MNEEYTKNVVKDSTATAVTGLQMTRSQSIATYDRNYSSLQYATSQP